MWRERFKPRPPAGKPTQMLTPEIDLLPAVGTTAVVRGTTTPGPFVQPSP